MCVVCGALGAAGCTTNEGGKKEEGVSLALTGRPSTRREAPPIPSGTESTAIPAESTEDETGGRNAAHGEERQEKEASAQKKRESIWTRIMPAPKPLTIHPDTIEEVRERERKRRERKKKMTILGRLFGKKRHAHPQDETDDSSSTDESARHDGTGQAVRTVSVNLSVSAKIPQGSESIRLVVPVPLSSPRQNVDNLAIATDGVAFARRSRNGGLWHVDIVPGEKADEVSANLSCHVRRTASDTPVPVDVAKLYSSPAAPEFRQKAREIAPKGNATERARTIFRAICREIRLIDRAGALRGDGSKALAEGSGNVSDLAALFANLCRATGIPARLVAGVRLPPHNSPDAPQPQRLYAWAEFLDESSKWIPVEMGVGAASGGANGFARLAGDYLPLAVDTDEPSLPPMPALFADEERIYDLTLKILCEDLE